MKIIDVGVRVVHNFAALKADLFQILHQLLPPFQICFH